MDQKKIKILRIINRFNIGGPTYNATFLTRFISDEFETLLVGGLPEEGEADSLHILEEYGVTPILINEMRRVPNVISDRKALRKIKEIIKEFKPDIVHTHAAKAGALGRFATLFSIHKPKIIIHTYHGNIFDGYFSKLKTYFFLLIERFLAKITTAIIAISEKQKYDLIYKYKISNSRKVHVCPLGFDLSKFFQNRDFKRKIFRSKYNFHDKTIVITIIGRITQIKNHKLFIDVAFNILNRNLNLDIKFLIVGDGELIHFLKEYIKSLNLSYTFMDYSNTRDSNFIFTSWEKEIDYVIQASDIICLTSTNEGTPVSIIEAMASKKPVISTNVGGVTDIITNGFNGIISNLDTKDYTNDLINLISNKELRNLISINAENSINNFDQKILVQNILYIYQKYL